MVAVFVVGFLTVAVYFFVKYLANYYRQERMVQVLKGPKPLPIVGNALDLANKEVMLETFEKYLKTYGSTVKIYVGPHLNLLTYDNKLLEFLLTSHTILDKTVVYRFLYDWIGTGLLTANAEKWKKHRKIIGPAFHVQILDTFIETFVTNTQRLVQILEKNVGKDIDIFPYVTLQTLDIICETAMGTSVNAQENSESKYVKSVKEMCRIVIERGFDAIQQFDTFYKFTSNYKTEKESLKILHGYTMKVIKQKKKEYEEREKQNNSTSTSTSANLIQEEDVSIKKRKRAFLDLLLEESYKNNSLTEDEIRQEVDTFMFEGHDTTASGIAFTLYCLSTNDDVQEKVYQEQLDILHGDFDKTFSMADLNGMKYLDMVVKESLRLYPPVPIFARQSREDVKFENYVIPKEVPIMIFVYGIHRNPEYFADPDKFDPERFSTENFKEAKPFSYVPFSTGPRNCIGQRFAMLELKTTVSKIIQKFKLLPVKNYQPKLMSEVVLKASNGILIKLEKRKTP